jgi:uncharacterized protein (TIGR03066 family)
MRTAIAVVAVGLLAFPHASRGADDSNALIVGVWEIVYSDARTIAVGTRLEFTKQGKVSLTKKMNGKDVTIDAGGYKVEKDLLTLTGKDGNTSDKGRICLLNKSSLVLNDEVEDKVLVLKRVKTK